MKAKSIVVRVSWVLRMVINIIITNSNIRLVFVLDVYVFLQD